MDCTEWKEGLNKLLKNQWSGEKTELDLPVDIIKHVEECTGCSDRLQAALLLVNGEKLRKSPPAGLVDRAKERLIHAGEVRQSKRAKWPIAAAATLLIALTSFFLFTYITPSSQDMITVRLILEAPGAVEVSVVGDWNSWDPEANKLSDIDGDGIWEIKMQLKCGSEYRYQFLINRDEWIPDPNASIQIEDGFGGTNSILEI